VTTAGHGPGRARRWLFAALGAVSTGLAVLGAILPGVPTTIFLIIASYCFARSCPWIMDRVLALRIFAPYAPYVREGAPMPRRARIAAIGLMWLSVSISLAWLAYTGWLGWRSGAIIAGTALVGTAVILSVRRGDRA